jgi:hypothetical protein
VPVGFRRAGKEADIVVEVLGRYGQTKVLVADKYIGFDLLPGRISAKVPALVPREWAEKLPLPFFGTFTRPIAASPGP